MVELTPNMKVKIRDYRIIANMELEFFPGLNILQGPSNSGKSSVVGAIKSCIYNIPGTTNVRHGQNDYYVGIQYRGHEVLYKKGKSGNTYVVDNEQYTKTGVNQLPVVGNALGIQDVILGDEKIKINFWNQMSYPFLLDKTPGQLFKFIADSGEDEGLTSAQKSMVKDRQSTAVQYTLTEGKLQAEKDRIKSMEEDVKSAEEELKVCETIISLDSEINNLNNITNINNKIKQLNKSKSEKNIILNNIKVNERVVEEVNNLENEINLLVKYQSIFNKYQSLTLKKSELGSILKEIPQVDISLLERELAELSSLGGIKSRFDSLTNVRKTKQSGISQLQVDITDVETKLKEFKVCPLCGSSLTDNLIHEERGA